MSTDEKYDRLENRVYILENYTSGLEDYIVKMAMRWWDENNNRDPGQAGTLVTMKRTTRDDYEKSVRDEISRLRRTNM